MVLLVFKNCLSCLEAFTVVGFSLPYLSNINLNASSVLRFGSKIKVFSTVQFGHIVSNFLFVMISFKSIGHLHIGYFSHNNNFLEQVLNQVFLCVNVGVRFVTRYVNVRSHLPPVLIS